MVKWDDSEPSSPEKQVKPVKQTPKAPGPRIQVIEASTLPGVIDNRGVRVKHEVPVGTGVRVIYPAGAPRPSKGTKQASMTAAPQEELVPVPPSPPVFSIPELPESEPGPVQSAVKDGIGQDWREAWDPEKGNPPTDASRTLYAIITGKTSRDGKMILAYLREHYNTPAALVRLREYDLKMAKWASRRLKAMNEKS